MSVVRTRFAPSPSGWLHIGGARTALFNWLYARNNNGTFILRIEDTDTLRSTKASVDAIIDSLSWMGIDWDEGPFFQSQRLEIYKKYIQKLIDNNKAYYCTCSSEILEAKRKAAMASGGKVKYDGTCRNKGLAKSDNAVVRFRCPQEGTTILKDCIKDNIEFQNSELDDFIIMRANEMPTYNFVVVVDDIEMGINTIIRGDDHVTNTPRQILLYKALEADIPVFGHVPMVCGSDRSRLSKRHGAMSVLEYRDQGYLPDALINYLVRLGWSFGDQEFFHRNELIEKFTIKNIGRSPSIFNPEKLLAINADHIKETDIDKLCSLIKPFLEEKKLEFNDLSYLKKAIITYQKRSKTLKEMSNDILFYFENEIKYDAKAEKKFFKSESIDIFQKLIAKIENIDIIDEISLENAFKEIMNETNLKLGKIAQPVRLALTGKTASPSIFEVIDILGKEKTINRLNMAIENINKSQK